MLILFLSYSSLTKADESSLTIDEAMQLAISTHPSILSKKSEIDSASFGLDAAKWQRFPSVSAQTSGGQPGKNSVLTSVRIDQPLWAGGRINAGIESATSKLSASEASLADAEQIILEKVVNAYCQMVKLQEQILTANENIIEHQRLMELIQHRADGNVSPQNEFVMAKARLASARNERMQYQNAMLNAKADLEQLTSKKIIRLKVPKPEITLSKALTETLDSGIEFSPQLKKLEADIASSESDVTAKKSLLYPQLSARYEAFNGSNYPSDMAYLALTFQPGNGLSALSSAHEAESRIGGLQSQKETYKKELTDKLRNDYNTVQLSLNQVDVMQELSDSSREVYESFVRQYPAGRKTWVEVLNARREATQARLSLAEAQWGGYAASLRIKINTGEIDRIRLSISN